MLTGAPLSRCAASNPPKPAPTMTTRWAAAGRVCSVVIGSASRGLKCLRTFDGYVVVRALASKSGARSKPCKSGDTQTVSFPRKATKEPVQNIFMADESLSLSRTSRMQDPTILHHQSQPSTTNPGENDETGPDQVQDKARYGRQECRADCRRVRGIESHQARRRPLSFAAARRRQLHPCGRDRSR